MRLGNPVLQSGLYSYKWACDRKNQTIKQKRYKHVWRGDVLAPALLGFLSALLGEVWVTAQNWVSMSSESIIKGKIGTSFYILLGYWSPQLEGKKQNSNVLTSDTFPKKWWKLLSQSPLDDTLKRRTEWQNQMKSSLRTAPQTPDLSELPGELVVQHYIWHSYLHSMPRSQSQVQDVGREPSSQLLRMSAKSWDTAPRKGRFSWL